MNYKMSGYSEKLIFISRVVERNFERMSLHFQDSELCISLGMSLQYLRVSVVCWLASMCHHLYATVASLPRRDDPPTYLKYSLFAWGAPLISLALATFLQSRESNNFWNVVDLTPFNCW